MRNKSKIGVDVIEAIIKKIKGEVCRARLILCSHQKKLPGVLPNLNYASNLQQNQNCQEQLTTPENAGPVLTTNQFKNGG